jgi:hypothetical protein
LAAELPAAAPSSSTPRKPVVALSVIGLLLMAGAGAVLTTLRSRPGSAAPEPPAALIAQPATTEGPANTATTTFTEAPGDGDSESVSVDEPQEWERELVRARRALARGRFDRAYVIAEELPADSVLRETPISMMVSALCGRGTSNAHSSKRRWSWTSRASLRSSARRLDS